MNEREQDNEHIRQAEEALDAFDGAMRSISQENPYLQIVQNARRNILDEKANIEFAARPDFEFGVVEQDNGELSIKNQIERCIALGFHTELGMTEDEYRNSIPSLGENEKDLIGKKPGQKYISPKFIETRISPRRILELGNIKIHKSDLQDIENPDLSVTKFPYKLEGEPYLAYLRNGGLPRFVPIDSEDYHSTRNISDVMRNQNGNLTGGFMNFYEGVMTAIYMDLPYEGQEVTYSIPFYEYKAYGRSPEPYSVIASLDFKIVRGSASVKIGGLGFVD